MVNIFSNKINKLTAVSCVLIILNIFLILVLNNFKYKLKDIRSNLLMIKEDKIKLDKLQSDFDSEGAKLDKAMKTIPATYSDIAKLTYKIEAISVESSLSSLDVSYDRQPNLIDGVNSVGLKIITQGGYQNYKNFIKALSNLPYNINIVSSSFENDEGQLIQTTVLRVYLQKS
jgi:hypothetical protein